MVGRRRRTREIGPRLGATAVMSWTNGRSGQIGAPPGVSVSNSTTDFTRRLEIRPIRPFVQLAPSAFARPVRERGGVVLSTAVQASRMRAKVSASTSRTRARRSGGLRPLSRFASSDGADPPRSAGPGHPSTPSLESLMSEASQCRRRKFPSRRLALQNARRRLRHGDHQQRRTWRCPICGSWHVGTEADAQWQREHTKGGSDA